MLRYVLFCVMSLLPVAVQAQQQSMTITCDDSVEGAPGEEVSIPLTLQHASALAGMQVNVAVEDTTVGAFRGFELTDTVADEMIQDGAFKVIGKRGIAVALPRARVYKQSILVRLRFQLKKSGKTPVHLRIALAEGDNPPVSKRYTLRPVLIAR